MNSERRQTGSKSLARRASELIPGGVNSNVRMGGPKVFFARGKGPRLWDVDGNEYIDYLLGQGPNLLGHAPDDVHTRVMDATTNGMIYGAQHPQEVDAAEAVLDTIQWADQVRFGVSGTESVQAALRLARAYTGRRKFVRFEGHYHGWLDNVLAQFDDGGMKPASAGQVGEYLDDGIALPWNDADAVREVLELSSHEIAAIITEPMMLNAGSILPENGFLEELRSMCNDYGVVLIFDEVITGFRISLGGAVERFGVTPDLAVYGKAIAGGWPVSVLAGRRNLMERFGTGEVNHSGTFNGSVMASAAVLATLERLKNQMPYDAMEDHGQLLMSVIRQASDDHGLGLHVQGIGMGFHVSFGVTDPIRNHHDLRQTDAARYGIFAGLLFEQGIFVAQRGVWYVSAAHGQREADEASHRIQLACKAMAQEES